MKSLFMKGMTVAAAAGLMSGVGLAQTTVSLPDTSQTSTFTATVSEQAKVTVPSAIAFTVTDIATSTAASAAIVTIDDLVLPTATDTLKIGVQANASDFTPSVALATTWAASDVSWNAATWTSATGASGTLSDSAYGSVATCTAASTNCSTTGLVGLVFTLAAKDTVTYSGGHTLVMTWKFTSSTL
jgi:hypothetical protein